MTRKFDKIMNNISADKFLLFDGAMGTMLQDSGLEAGDLPEELNITNPDAIIDIHKAYLQAGSDVIITNTFGANRLKLKNSPYSVEEIITAGVENAQKAFSKYHVDYMQSNPREQGNLYDEGHGDHVLDKTIALDIGPIGSLLSPLGSLSFDEAYDIFKEQVIAGAKAAANIILIETMTDIYEVKAAVLAAKENCDLPVFCTMSFQENGRTFIGTDVATFVFVAESLGVDVLGANCSLGPVQLQPIVDDLVKYSSTPVMIQANAGLPKYKDGRTYYDISPEEYSKEIKVMAEKGVSIFGGCCGTTPGYIADLSSTLKDVEKKEMTKKLFTTCTSPSQTVFFGDEVKVIGERINPTGKKPLKEALLSNNLDYIIGEAIDQKETGSDILDINVGLPGINEKDMMINVIKEVQTIVSLPLQIDSASLDVVEAAVRVYNGKPIINSVNGKKESMETIFPIVKKYGTLVVALTLDEDGLPKTANKRLEIATNIIETAKTYGIPEENILVDPLVLTASAEQEAVMETLKSIPLIKERYNVKVVLGTSNVSFGLPNRSLLNSTYLAIALAYGLDAPITDSTNQSIMGAIRSFKVIANQDKGSEKYVDAYGNVTFTTSVTKVTESSASNIIESSVSSVTGNANQTLGSTKVSNSQKPSDLGLQNAIIKGLTEEAKRISIELLEAHNALDIMNDFMIPALDIVGEKYEKSEIFLPQLIKSSETSKEIFETLKKHSADVDTPDSTTIQGEKIIMATVFGDIHDIGKNIVSLILENYGYNVIDLGKDVPIEKIKETVQEENVKLVGLSALMTTTVNNMETTIKELNQAFPDIKIMVGGAVLTPEYANQIGANYYSKDAKGAVDVAKEVFETKS